MQFINQNGKAEPHKTHIYVLRRSESGNGYRVVAASHCPQVLMEHAGPDLKFQELTEGRWEARDFTYSDTPFSFVHLIISQVPVI